MNHGLSSISRFRRGAAMLIALLVFFLAVLSGTLALTMASSNAGRYTHEKDDQQAYLSVASAAKLILNTLEGASVEFRSQKEEMPQTADDVVINNTSEITARGFFFADSKFQKMLTVFSSPSSSATMATISDFKFDLTVESHAEMGTVHVDIHVQGAEFFFRLYSTRGSSFDYQMTLKVTTKFNGDGEGQNFTKREEGEEGAGYYFRTLGFETDKATFTNEILTGDLSE